MRSFITKEGNNFKRKTFFLGVWIFIWWILAKFVSKEMLLPSPLIVLKRMIFEMGNRDYYIRILNTTTRLSLGLFLSVVSSFLLASISIFYRSLEDFLNPLVSFLKSVPMVSFVIIILTWTSSEYLSVILSFIMGFPLLYEGILFSYKKVDENLLSMAYSFQANKRKIFKYIYLPSSIDTIKSLIIRTSSIMFKASVAAELIGLSKDSIGEAFYYSKIYLDTSGIFMWTISLVILTNVYEHLLEKVLRGSYVRSK